jgi:hypothetical protein
MDTPRRRTVTARVVTAVALTAALAACAPPSTPGSPSAPASATPPPAPTVTLAPVQLLEQGTRNMLDAPSKRLVGKVALAIATQELEVFYVGKDAKGTRTERAMGMESVVRFVKVGDSLYILASEHYWQGHVGLESLARLSNTWVRVAANNPNHGGLVALEENPTLMKPAGAVTQVGTDTIGGMPAVVLADTAGNRYAVATGATPYLLRVNATQNTEVGQATAEFTFSEFGAVTETISAPTGKIVDLR